MSLSVVHFSTADREGGSGRSAWRIHDGLRRRGHRSRMLVGYRVSDDPDVDTVSGGRLLRLADRAADAVTRRLGLQYLAVPSAARVKRHDWLKSPDIIQLYNTHGGYFGTRLLPWLATRAPLVWRFSDMWPATGHCAYAGPCERWRTGCGACPDLAAYPPVKRDRTATLWRLKRRLYRRANPTVVAPSSWSERVARESPLFAGAAVHRIPNGLDLAVFRPIDRAAARTVLNVDPAPRAILFSAHIASDNPRKGTDVLEAALNRLGPRDDAVLLVAGVGAEKWIGRVPQRVVPLGYLTDDRLIAAATAAADMVVVPSAVENLPNGIVEAFACARPVVAFDAGGIRDAVRDGETGLLVPTGDAGALAGAVESLLDDPALGRRLGDAALALARREFDAALEARRFEALYQDVIKERAA